MYHPKSQYLPPLLPPNHPPACLSGIQQRGELRSVIVLLSGGVDSSLCAVTAGPTLHSCLQVNYGQPAADQERAAAAALCAALGVERVPLRAYHPGLAAMRTGVGVAGPRVVPGRNLWLLSLAVSHAAALGLAEVWIGCNADDASNYPDCRPDFIAGLSTASESAYGVRVVAPLLHLTKRQVIATWESRGHTLDTTWSCYEPNGAAPCGSCDACRLRTSSE